MDERKSLIFRLAETYEHYRAERQSELAQQESTQRPGWWSRLRRHVVPNIGTLLIVAGLLWATNAGALPLRVPSATTTTSTGTIAYQGRLADSDGNPITETVNMEFRLYDAAEGGTPLWSELWTGSNAVRVSDGLFNVMLGSLEPIPQDVVAGQDQLWLGITVGTDDEMSPRVQLGSVPFAVQALTVPDGSVTTEKIADGAVTKTKLDLNNGLTVRGPTNNKALRIVTDYESRFRDQVTISSQLDSGYGIAFTGQGAHRGGIYAENVGGPDHGEGRVTIWARKNGDIILNGGKIGVGTGSPNAQLDVNGTSYFNDWAYFNAVGQNFVFNTDTSTRNVWEVKRGSAGDTGTTNRLWNVDITSADDLVFNAHSGGDFAITDGNVGIGTTSPEAKLDVRGDFRATGTKSAVVDAGTHGQRVLYAPESPEVRLFDEGLAQLTNGSTRVELDPIFLETIEGDYLVHVTPYGDAGLYVAEVGEDYFVVKARDGDPNVAFAWRLSAHRKGYAGVRLEAAD